MPRRRRHRDEHRVLLAEPARTRRHRGGVDTRGLRAPLVADVGAARQLKTARWLPRPLVPQQVVRMQRRGWRTELWSTGASYALSPASDRMLVVAQAS
jgi:hypothetical protein